VSRPGAWRIALPLGAAALGFAATTLSTALNFGPEHMLAWQTDALAPAFVLGLVVAGIYIWTQRKFRSDLLPFATTIVRMAMAVSRLPEKST